jgi:hypothetical protein
MDNLELTIWLSRGRHLSDMKVVHVKMFSDLSMQMRNRSELRAAFEKWTKREELGGDNQ